jgi:hypothetical protein
LISLTAGGRWRASAGRAFALIPIALLLAAVIVAVYRRYDGTGFDYDGHLDYLRAIDFSGSLPLANRGWQFYHPPAYYVISVITFEVAHRLSWMGSLTDAGRAVATGAWVLEGLLAAIAVRVAGGNWVGWAAAAALVWMLPGQSIMGSMIYMETMTGLGEGLLVLGILAWDRGHWWGLVCIGIGLPLAALAKYSGLAAVAAAVAVLLWVSRRRLRPVLLALAPGSAVAGAFYLRNLIFFHTPTPLNSELFGLKQWDPIRPWGVPAGFFTRFDQGLAHSTQYTGPCAAYDSFWGGVWKWFWATDCVILPWRSDVRGWLLVGAVIATAVVVVALAWAISRTRHDPAVLVLAAVPLVVFAFFLYYTIRVPSATADKGVYLLNAVVPVGVAVGLLISRIVPRAPAGLIAYAVVLGWCIDMAHASGLG